MILETVNNFNLLIDDATVKRAESSDRQALYVNAVVNIIRRYPTAFCFVGAWQVMYANDNGRPTIKFVSGSIGTSSFRCNDNFDEEANFIDFSLFNFSGVTPTTLVLTAYSEDLWVK